MSRFIPDILPDLLNHACEKYPEHGFGFVHPNHEITIYSFGEIRHKAMEILAALRHHGLMQKDRVILSLDTAEEIIPALWACFYGGFIPALLQPPLSFSEYNPAAEKASRVFEILDGPYVILSHAHAASWQKSNIPAEKLLDVATLKGNPADAFISPGIRSDLALIQFSSGSTGDPRGVMLTHENILINTTDIIKGIRLEPEDVSVNWMPLYHDMGLIGFHITPVFAGVTQYFINPVDFVKNPFLWLDILHAKRGTITACPNFGQVLLNRHLSRKPTKKWDLSSVRILFNGAEPISVTTMRSFLHGLNAFGLKSTAMFPAYGLAEATLAVTFPDPCAEAGIVPFNRNSIIRDGVAVVSPPDDPATMELVELGVSLDNCSFRITDNKGEPLPEGVVGHVLVTGKNVSGGYFSNPVETSATFHQQWLRTGDLGFFFRGNLFITGRSKDIIFINGMNYYAHDIEHVATQMEGIVLGRIVVSGNFDDADGRDKLLIFLVGPDNEETRSLCKQLKNHLSTLIGINPDIFIPVKSSDIPRTSSGKIQRYKLVDRFRKGEFSHFIFV
jgi:acyl-CoA synthetase (AMP-forming)/AMP-acid ligase II